MVSISGIDFFEPVKRQEFQATPLSRDEALALEPELNPDLLSAVKVPDGAIDPFALVLENAKDAEDHGAKILLHTEVTSLILDGDKVKGAKAKDLLQGEEYSIEASYSSMPQEPGQINSSNSPAFASTWPSLRDRCSSPTRGSLIG